MAKTIELGRVYRDTITGMVGVAVSKTEFLFACERIAIQPRGLHEGKIKEVGYFDIHQLELDPESLHLNLALSATEQKKLLAQKDTGGPGEVAPRHSVPSR